MHFEASPPNGPIPLSRHVSGEQVAMINGLEVKRSAMTKVDGSGMSNVARFRGRNIPFAVGGSSLQVRARRQWYISLASKISV
jgi:hypothetical protein